MGNNLLESFPVSKDTELSFLRFYQKAISECSSETFEEYYAPLNLWISVTIYLRKENGCVIFYRDITKQKQAQIIIESERQKLEAFFADSPASLALLEGPGFIFVKINTNYAEPFKGREILNKPPIEALPELKEDSPLPSLMKTVYESGEPYIGQEMLIPLIKEANEPL